jgi:DNA-binding transcriptional ArsR family regulator
VKAYSHPSLDDVPLPTVMQALSDPCRIAIVRALLEGPGELACNEVPLKISKATRSHHFTVLREAGLAFTRTDGTKCMTSIRRAEFDARFPGLLDLVLRGDAGKAKRPLSRSAR